MSVDVKPPSTQRFWPVMYDASGLSSNAMAAASSEGSATWPSGTASARRAARSGSA